MFCCPPSSTEQYIVDQDTENQDGERHQQVKMYAFGASSRRGAGRGAMATPVVGNGESVAARHTRIERHLDQGYSRYVTYLEVSRKHSPDRSFSSAFRSTNAVAGLFHDPDISLQSRRWILVSPRDAAFRHNHGIERPEHNPLVLESL